MTRRLAGLAVSTWLAAGPAWASNHAVRLEQVLAGANGDSRVQYVELKFAIPTENVWGPQAGNPAFPEPRAILSFHDASGAQTGTFAFPADPTLGPVDPASADHSVLVATQAFQD